MKKSIVYTLLAFAAIVWGVSFIMTKELFRTEPHITVFIILAMRLMLATVVTIPTLLLLRRLEPIRRGDWKWFLLLSLAEPVIYSVCETSGVRLVSGSLASIVVATIPLFVPFGMAVAYRERLQPVTLVGIVLSLVGLAVMSGVGGMAEGNLAAGLAWLAGAVAIAVVYTVLLVKLVGRYRPFTITGYQNLFGFIMLLPVVLLIDGAQLPLLSYSPRMWALLLVLGILCSTVAYVFYNIGVHRLGATAACIFTNTIPVFSLIAALLIGQESFAWNKPVGMAIVLTGVVLVQLKTKS